MWSPTGAKGPNVDSGEYYTGRKAHRDAGESVPHALGAMTPKRPPVRINIWGVSLPAGGRLFKAPPPSSHPAVLVMSCGDVTWGIESHAYQLPGGRSDAKRTAFVFQEGRHAVSGP